MQRIEPSAQVFDGLTSAFSNFILPTKRNVNCQMPPSSSRRRRLEEVFKSSSSRCRLEEAFKSSSRRRRLEEVVSRDSRRRRLEEVVSRDSRRRRLEEVFSRDSRRRRLEEVFKSSSRRRRLEEVFSRDSRRRRQEEVVNHDSRRRCQVLQRAAAQKKPSSRKTNILPSWCKTDFSNRWRTRSSDPCTQNGVQHGAPMVIHRQITTKMRISYQAK